MTADLRIDEALAIHRVLGEYGARWLTEQLSYLAENGDTIGVKRFRRIASAYQRLTSAI